MTFLNLVSSNLISNLGYPFGDLSKFVGVFDPHRQAQVFHQIPGCIRFKVEPLLQLINNNVLVYSEEGEGAVP